VRLLLDAHISGSRVGDPLRAKGHDVHALGQDRQNEGLDAEAVLALAAAERRILVTHDVKDFPEILREWAEARRSHAGVFLVYGIRPSEFGTLVGGLERLFEERPRQVAWIDVVRALGRSR
jgi:hypothetical protein